MITYPDLTKSQYTYNSFSEPLTATDENNHTTSFTYDAQWQPGRSSRTR